MKLKCFLLSVKSLYSTQMRRLRNDFFQKLRNNRNELVVMQVKYGLLVDGTKESTLTT